MELKLLTGPFVVQEDPGLKITDERFQVVSTHALEGRYIEAGEAVGKLLKEKIYDLRVLGYFVFAHFQQEGPAGLEAIFKALEGVLGDGWEAFGPSKNKSAAVDTSLTWFVKQLARDLDFNTRRRTKLLRSWIDRARPQTIAAGLEAGRQLSRLVLERTGGKSQSFELLLKVLKQLDEFKSVVQGVSEGDESALIAEESGAETREEGTLESSQATPESEQDIASQRHSGRRTSPQADEKEPWLRVAPAAVEDPIIPFVEGSYHLTQLIKKLHAFELLVKRREYGRAAVVAADLENTISNFDPMKYLPKLFAGYRRLFADNVSTISEYWENRETLAWKALEKHFEVDLDSFMNHE